MCRGDAYILVLVVSTSKRLCISIQSRRREQKARRTVYQHLSYISDTDKQIDHLLPVRVFLTQPGRSKEGSLFPKLTLSKEISTELAGPILASFSTRFMVIGAPSVVWIQSRRSPGRDPVPPPSRLVSSRLRRIKHWYRSTAPYLVLHCNPRSTVRLVGGALLFFV
jgi:hypothetical protein